MKTIQIGEYQIILQNLDKGQGKIIIASSSLNASYYWGAMGCSLEEFICSIDSYYWLNKLLPPYAAKVVNTRKTFAAFRKYLFGEALYCYPWYKFIEFHKELRSEIQSLQSDSEAEYQFIDNILCLAKRAPYYLIDDRYDREHVEEIMKEACSEPWHFVVNGESREEKQLLYIHKELKKRLNKQVEKLTKAA